MIERAAWTNEPSSKWPDGPVPRELPPVAHPPRVVALARAVDGDRLVADRHGAGDPRRDLVARRHRVRERLGPARPLEVEPHRDRRTLEPVERLRRIGQLHPDRVLCTRKRCNGSGTESSTLVAPAAGVSAASPSGHGSSWSTTSTSGRSGTDERDPPPRQTRGSGRGRAGRTRRSSRRPRPSPGTTTRPRAPRARRDADPRRPAVMSNSAHEIGSRRAGRRRRTRRCAHRARTRPAR